MSVAEGAVLLPRHDTLWSAHFLWVKLAATVYVLAIPVSHYALPHDWAWGIAFAFLVAMLFTYPIASVVQNNAIRLELSISLGLAAIGLLGLLTTPWLLIAAIFGHGLWDFMKYRGYGCGFFDWYVTGCMAVDWTYAAALSLYLIMFPTAGF